MNEKMDVRYITYKGKNYFLVEDVAEYIRELADSVCRDDVETVQVAADKLLEVADAL